MVNLTYLKEWAKQYFYTSEEDETLFREYMNRLCYKNGVLDFCAEATGEIIASTLKEGTLDIDSYYDLFYENGVIEGINTDDLTIITYTGGVLWLID